MNKKKFTSDNSGVSPVIGVILMVAITVILAAVIGTFVMGLGQNAASTQASASVSAAGNSDITLNSLGPNTDGIKCNGVDESGGDTDKFTEQIGDSIDCSSGDHSSVVAFSNDDSVEDAVVYTFDE